VSSGGWHRGSGRGDLHEPLDAAEGGRRDRRRDRAFDRLRAPGAGRPRVIDASPACSRPSTISSSRRAGGIPSVDCAGPRSRPASCLRSCWRRVSREPRHGGGPAAPDGLQPASAAKENEGAQHADRDAQFRHIDALARAHLSDGSQSSLSTPKRRRSSATSPTRARNGSRRATGYESTSTTSRPEVPKAVPYGIYDLAQNEGFVSVGDSHDTAEFAVETIRRWWAEVGSSPTRCRTAPHHRRCRRSNSYRSRLWRLELSKLAAEAGIDITVCHFPPGTSKWNKSFSTPVPGCLRSTNEASDPSRTSATSLPRALSITSSMSSYTLPLRDEHVFDDGRNGAGAASGGADERCRCRSHGR